MALKEYLSKLRLPAPELHIVLGSGYSAAFASIDKPGWIVAGELSFGSVAEIESASVEGHPGKYVFLKHEKTSRLVTLQLGRLHGYEGIPPQKVVQTVLEGVRAGTQSFILTNASGGLSPNHKPGSVMIFRDHINLTGQNPLSGPNTSGPRFPDMTDPYDSILSKGLKASLKKNKVKTFDGIYAGLAGPNYETRAEVQLLKKLGMGAVGMSTVWETLALRHAGARVAAMALITNLGAGISKVKLVHEDVLKQAAKSAQNVVRSILDFASRRLP